MPDHFRKFFFRNKLISATPPPSPNNFRSVYHFRGQKNFSGTINCRYCPTFKRILHDYLYLSNKLRAFWLFYFPLFARLMLNICPTFRLCNLFGVGGAVAPPAPPGPYANAYIDSARRFHSKLLKTLRTVS